MHRFAHRTLLSLTLAGALVAAADPAAGAQGARASMGTATAGPNITVVGFGLATEAATAAGGYQLNLDFQVSNASLARDLQDIEAAVRHAEVRFAAVGVPRAQIAVQPVNVNLNQNSPLQVQEQMTVTFRSLAQFQRAAGLLSHGGGLAAVNNYYLMTNGGGPGSVTPAALRTAYAQAWTNARKTAQALAQAQGLVLGAAVAESEGQAGQACGMGGVCPTVPYQGAIGPGQQLEAVTVTFATTRAA